jgi:hypothetical protein
MNIDAIPDPTRVVIECVFVGMYCLMIYMLFPKIQNIHTVYFIVGFSKHLLGYLTGLHSLYCKYGTACKWGSSATSIYSNHLLMECIIEGVLFVCLRIFFVWICTSLMNVKITRNTELAIIFSIGVCLHILFEVGKIHGMFCKYRCISNTNTV